MKKGGRFRSSKTLLPPTMSMPKQSISLKKKKRKKNPDHMTPNVATYFFRFKNLRLLYLTFPREGDSLAASQGQRLIERCYRGHSQQYK